VTLGCDDVLYAAACQRRRHVWTMIDGGPESGIYRSMNGGQNWRKINKGLPDSNKGRIGLAVSPVNPDVVYAVDQPGPDPQHRPQQAQGHGPGLER